MKTLINETERMLLKLEDRLRICMETREQVCMSIECEFTNILNTICIDDYSVDKQSIHLSYDYFEHNIILTDKTRITYDDIEDSFKFTYDKANIILCFV